MNSVNNLVICKDNFKDDNAFKNEVANAIMLLLNNDYIMTVKYDVNDKGAGVVVIEYEASDESWGCPYPYWLSPKQSLMLEDELENEGEDG